MAKNQKRTVCFVNWNYWNILCYCREKNAFPKEWCNMCQRLCHLFFFFSGIASIIVNTIWLSLNHYLPSSMPHWALALIIIKYYKYPYSWIFQILLVTIISVIPSKIWHCFCNFNNIVISNFIFFKLFQWGGGNFRDFHITLSKVEWDKVNPSTWTP